MLIFTSNQSLDIVNASGRVINKISLDDVVRIEFHDQLILALLRDRQIQGYQMESTSVSIEDMLDTKSPCPAHILLEVDKRIILNLMHATINIADYLFFLDYETSDSTYIITDSLGGVYHSQTVLKV